MKSSEKKTARRRILDINFRRDARFFTKWFLGWEDRVVNLRPTFFKKYKLRWVLAVFLAVFLIFAVNKLFTRAEVTDFYPQTCLGSWQNPENSQGEPQNFNLASSSFSENNSAIFTSEKDKIFCGKFLADDYVAEGNIKNVGLTLVWNVEGAAASQPSVESGEIKTNAATSSESESTSTSADGKAVDFEQKESFLKNSPFLDENSGVTLWGLSFVKQALAEELSSTAAMPVADQAQIPASSSSDQVINNEIQTPAPSTETSSVPGEEPKPVDESLIAPPAQNENSISNSTTSNSSSSQSQDESSSSNSGAQDSSSTQNIEESSSSTAVIAPAPPDNNFLKINYSFDGQNWFELSRVSGDNWKNLTINLPNVSWDDLRHLQISVEGIPTTLEKAPKVFLDGMFLEIQYDIPPIINLNSETKDTNLSNDTSEENRKELPMIVLPGDKKPIPAENKSEDFTPSESPRFDFDLNNLPESTSSAPGIQGTSPPTSKINEKEKAIGFNTTEGGAKTTNKNSKKLLSAFLDFFGFRGLARAQESLAVGGGVVSAQNPIVGQVIDPFNKKTDIQPLFLTVNNNLRISIPEPERDFKPGRYKLQLWVYKNGIVYFTTKDFTWGVLAVNFNKSIFTKGDKARIGAAVLTDMGHTICDAELNLRVTDPNGNFYVFSTGDGSVTRSETCGPETVTNEPDYLAETKARIIGTYKVSVTAKTSNGVRSIEDKFEVQAEPIFDVERDGPTRIFPPSNYKVTLHIKANQDFKGVVMESMPVSFKLITEKISTEEVLGNDRVVRWDLDLKKGESQDLVYFFKAPDISPELYKLGPLSFSADAVSGGGSLVFEEARQWQVAADAAGDVIILWDGANIPDGWTCLSCLATDIFFNVFPRASSTPGVASSSLNNASHTLTFSTDNGPSDSTSTGESAGSAHPSNTHTHANWPTATTTNDSIVPLDRGLKFISAATTTLPNGAIAIFDVSSSSLPANWIYASTTESRYLIGSSTIGNGGSATHVHNPSAVITSGLPNKAITDTANNTFFGGASHTHSVATSSALTASNNSPPYIGVVFGQLTTTTTIPTGMIAMFDNVNLPANWSSISTSGSAYVGNLIIGSSTFGSVGGSSTHNHGGSVTFSGTYFNEAFERMRAATSTGNVNGTTRTHTQSVTYTVSSENSMPVYRDVILGQYTAPAVLNVSNVVLNGGSAIVLLPNTTTTISVVASTTGANLSYATGTISRSGVGFNCAADNLNCYQIPSSSCAFSGTSPVSSTVTCSADIYYFAQATDASSSFAAQNWLGQITLTDTTPTSTSSSTASGVELNTLLAINITTSSINYGSLNPLGNTGLANQTVSVQNAGNASSSIGVSGTAMTFGSNVIATSSQHYASSTFSFGGSEGVLSDTVTTISGVTTNPRVGLVNDLGTWSTTTNLPNPNPIWYDGVAVAKNGYMYVIGGEWNSNQSTSSVHYAAINSDDGTLGSWTQTQSLPTSTERHAGFEYNGYLYVLGGVNLTGVAAVTSTVLYASLNSNGTIGSWTNTTALPQALNTHRGFAYNGFAYVSGGSDSATNRTSTVLYSPINSNGTIGSWSETTALPSALQFHLAMARNGYAYIIGGGGAGFNATTSVWYAPINSNGTIGTWLATTALPGALGRGAGFVNGDYLYTLGGQDSDASATTTTLYAPINSNGTLGSWTNATALTAATRRNMGTTYNGYGYTLGGIISFTSTYYAPINSGRAQADTFWGLTIPTGVATGTYSGVDTFTASYVP